MRRPPRPAGRLASGLLALVLTAAVALLWPPSPAAAHGTLAMSTPAEGATVEKPVATVELYFTEKVRDDAYFTVTAPGGGRVDNGWTHGTPKPLDQPVREYFLVDGVFEPREYTTGFPALVTLAQLPATGQYSVSYLSVALDGDPVRGTVSFRYTGKATAAPPGWQPRPVSRSRPCWPPPSSTGLPGSSRRQVPRRHRRCHRSRRRRSLRRPRPTRPAPARWPGPVWQRPSPRSPAWSPGGAAGPASSGSGSRRLADPVAAPAPGADRGPPRVPPLATAATRPAPAASGDR
ncbi:copper resistance CopC family protein [Micromonospora tarapacensis]|uniref:copper resistance CopC family protein n=1 Tax=Micromonospora tarapacensis TaxID=2835305 RepID=UPI001E30250D|nr:copper resistance protein CopC [Micromonospora tarapacensis]